ncbi:MAG TPA: SMC-Scp complex subunit ScpB [Candidatus Paceibacterota bacterium]|nr:SMC-Scp complex subunit ScpB [Candidatus Paceibacterota bacterium]
MNDQELSNKIEALLFALGGPIARKELIAKLTCTSDELELAIRHLREARSGGIVCVDDGTTLELRASPETSALVEEVRKEELSRDIGRAGLEALSAILYRGPLTRSEIDFIRGVNSSQTLRTLLMRGLVRKIENPKDARQWLYEPTTELLSQLGVEHRDELPEFEIVRGKLAELEAAYRLKESQNNETNA